MRTRSRLAVAPVVPGLLALALALAFPAATLGNPLDSVPMLYQATSVDQGGSSTTVLVPRPMDRVDPARLADTVLRAFDRLKADKPADYGTTALSIDADFPRTHRVVLNLDPNKGSSWDRVASEVFYTLRSLGISEVRAPALREAPLEPSALRTPTYVLVLPYYDALPPKSHADALVVLSPTEILPWTLFDYRLRMGDKDLLDKVLAGLNSRSETVRLAVLSAVPDLPIDRRSARLIPLLDDKSAGVRLAVLKLLEKDNEPAVNDRLGRVVETDPDPSVKLAAVRMLSARGIKKYDVIIEMEALSDASEDKVIGAIGRLAASNNPVVTPAIAAALRAASPKVRVAAREALVRMNAYDRMAEALPDDGVDLATREDFARKLAEYGTPEQKSKALAHLLTKGSENAAAWAVGRLAESRPADGLALLFGALQRPEPAVRQVAAKAIGAYRSPDSIGPLLAAARTPDDKTVAEQVVVSILGSLTMDAVLAKMDDPDVTVRRLAMKALGDALKGSTPPPKAVAVLQARLQDPDPGVRRAAVYALARLPDDRVAASLLTLARDPDAELREAAVVAATRLMTPEAEKVLLKGLDDESDKVKAAALDAVAARKMVGARESLAMMATYRDTNVRKKAVQAWLALLQPGEAAPNYNFLSSLLYDKEPEIKIAILRVVITIPERKAILAVSSLAIDPDTSVKLAVIDALAKTKEKDAMEGLQKAVFDTDTTVKIAALDGLQRLGRPEAVDFLNELINLESDPAVKAKAGAVRDALLGR
jgi:HEAT repeat protein